MAPCELALPGWGGQSADLQALLSESESPEARLKIRLKKKKKLFRWFLHAVRFGDHAHNSKRILKHQVLLKCRFPGSVCWVGPHLCISADDSDTGGSSTFFQLVNVVIVVLAHMLWNVRTCPTLTPRLSESGVKYMTRGRKGNQGKVTGFWGFTCLVMWFTAFLSRAPRRKIKCKGNREF